MSHFLHFFFQIFVGDKYLKKKIIKNYLLVFSKHSFYYVKTTNVCDKNEKKMFFKK